MSIRRIVASLGIGVFLASSLAACNGSDYVQQGYQCDFEEMEAQEIDLICDGPYGAVDVEIHRQFLAGRNMTLPATVTEYSYQGQSQFPDGALVVIGDGTSVWASVEEPSSEVEGHGGHVMIGGKKVKRHTAYKSYHAPRRAPESQRPKVLERKSTGGFQGSRLKTTTSTTNKQTVKTSPSFGTKSTTPKTQSSSPRSTTRK